MSDTLDFTWDLPPYAEPSDEMFRMLDWLKEIEVALDDVCWIELTELRDPLNGELTPQEVDALLSRGT